MVISPSFPSLFASLEQLVSLPSVSCTNPDFDQPNLSVIQLLADWLEKLGFCVEILPLANQLGKANLIATLGAGPGGLVLAGHTDTVPYDDKLWQHNPLALTERDGRLYGLGTSDMKGFFPIVIEAAKKYLGTPLKQPLIILATADEESSMSGAKALVELGKPLARYAVIGEPTGMRPIRLHKGMMMEAIRVHGQSGHSSNPALGRNALAAMHDVLGEVLQFQRQLAQGYQNSHFEIAFPTLNLGCIRGGDNPNRICGHCDLEIDIRPIPGMDLDVLRETLNNRIQPVAAKHQVSISVDPLFDGIPAHETAATSDLVLTLEKLTGCRAGSVNFATEAPFLSQLGMETVVLGPGDIEQAHQPDEYLSIDRIQPTIDLLQKLIKNYCL